MTTWIALFRGINVGGHNKLPMRDLKLELEKLELHAVGTYIQSGNVVFQSKSKSCTNLTKKISRAVATKFGFEPAILLITLSQLQSVIQNNPFPKATKDPALLHVWFLEETPTQANLEALLELKSKTENVELRADQLYLFAPDGISRSKLANGLERKLNVAGTGRNWRTVTRLLEMAESIG